jgi:tetratricopeptide (TPR) repeat protein
VNSGHVFTGHFGPPYRRSYSIKGDAVNLAARIMGQAEPGQVLATDFVLDRARSDFQVTALEPFMVKGKRHPVQAFDLGPLRGRKESDRSGDLPLVGREVELRIMSDVLSRARSGQGQVIDLVGEPGIGKSRLVGELRARAGEDRVLAAASDPYESTSPYHAFRGVLREAVGIPVEEDPASGGRALLETLDRVAPELRPWAPLIAIPLEVEVPTTREVDQLDLKFKREGLEQATSDLLGRLMTEPTMLIFEDVHWIDEASAQLLLRLCSDAASRPWVLCVSRREVDGGFAPAPAAHVVTIKPGPLDARQAAALAGAASEDHPLPPHVIAALADRSGGNPLFLMELAATTTGAEGLEALPNSVESLLAAQIDRLSAPDRTLLRYSSVLGTTFSSSLLEKAIAGERLAADERAWHRLADFVGDDGTGMFRFRHALVRDAAYEGLPYRRRRELHQRVGDAIEETAGADPEAQAEILSYHYFQAGRLESAWRYSRVAGRRAQEKFAIMEAAQFYRRALASAKGLTDVAPEEAAAVSESLGDVLERAGEYAGAAAAYRTARSHLAGDALAVAGLLLKEGVVRERSGRYSQAMRWYSRGLQALEGQDPTHPVAGATRAQLSVWYAAARRQQGRLRDCITWASKAVELAEASGDKAALAHAYRLLDWVYTELGRPERTQYRGLALPIYEELGDLVGQSDVLNNLGMDAYFEGRWEEALDLYERGGEARQKTGDAVNTAHFTNNIAEILSDQGRLDEAEALFQEALRVWKGAGFRLGIAFGLSNLGRVAARAGRPDEAERLYKDAEMEFAFIGAEGQLLEVEARRAENLMWRGDPERALQLVQDSLDRADLQEGLFVLRSMLQRLRAYALACTGMPAEARAALDESLRLASAVDARYELGLTLLARAHIAEFLDDPEAGSLEQEARSILAPLGVESLPERPLPLAARK